MLLVFAHTHPSCAVSRVSASFATRLARRTSAPTTACERSTHPAPSSTSPSRCTPAPRRHPGPTTAPAGGPTRWGPRARASRATRRARACRARATPAAVSPRARRAPARATDTPSRLSVHHEGFRVKKPLFSVSSDGPSPSGPSGVERSSRARVRTDLSAFGRFFGASSSAVHESQTVEYPFFATCAAKKLRLQRHKSPPGHLG